MRSQFLTTIQLLCDRRSAKSSNIRWWFSETRITPRRVGGFDGEDTHSFHGDAEAETLEDAPLQDAFWHQLEAV